MLLAQGARRLEHRVEEREQAAPAGRHQQTDKQNGNKDRDEPPLLVVLQEAPELHQQVARTRPGFLEKFVLLARFPGYALTSFWIRLYYRIILWIVSNRRRAVNSQN